jgi:Putative zinc-finger
MFDCANVEMRELLPELVAGTLDARTRARVEAHIASCAECASELETLRLVKSAFGNAPAIDVQRVVAALPKSTAAPRVSRGSAPLKRWMDWRVAAALTMITVGGLSLAVTQRLRHGNVGPRDSSLVEPPTNATPVPGPPSILGTPGPRTDTGKRAVRPTPTNASASTAQLSFAGGVGDIDEASIQDLLGALDEIDRAPVAPSAEPDRTPVLPVIKQGER